MVCNSSSFGVFDLRVVDGNASTAVTTAPTWVQWLVVQPSLRASVCSEPVPPPSTAVWSNASFVEIDVRDSVASALLSSGVARFVVYGRGVDGAGNVGVVEAMEWWVDTVPPAPPAIMSSPDAVTMYEQALFSFDSSNTSLSPGRVTVLYRVYRNGVVVGGANVTGSSLTLSVAAGYTYELEAWSVNQAGVAGTTTTSYTWQVLSSLVVVSQPGRHSGIGQPLIVFASNWTGQRARDVSGMTLQFLLLNDPNLGAFHTPLVCDPGRIGTATMQVHGSHMSQSSL